MAEHRGKQWQENIATIICQSATERRELAKHVQRASEEVSMGSGWETLGGEKLWGKKDVLCKIILIKAKNIKSDLYNLSWVNFFIFCNLIFLI